MIRSGGVLIVLVTDANEKERTMGLSLGDTAPDFEAETTEGKIKFHGQAPCGHAGQLEARRRRHHRGIGSER